MRFLVDENLPYNLILFLKKSGEDVLDIAESQFKGCSDEIIWKLAASEKRIIITRDLDFPLSRLKPYPAGLILIRTPNHFTASQITKVFTVYYGELKEKEVAGRITIIAPGLVRTRKLEF